MGTGRCPAVALWLKAGQAGNVQLVCLRCRVASYSTLFSVLELSPEPTVKQRVSVWFRETPKWPRAADKPQTLLRNGSTESPGPGHSVPAGVHPSSEMRSNVISFCSEMHK